MLYRLNKSLIHLHMLVGPRQYYVCIIFMICLYKMINLYINYLNNYKASLLWSTWLAIRYMTCPPLGTIAVIWTLRVYTGTAILTWGVVTFVYICGIYKKLSKLLNNFKIYSQKLIYLFPKIQNIMRQAGILLQDLQWGITHF